LTHQEPLPIKRENDGVVRAGWSDLLPGLLDQRSSPANRSSVFHSRLANTLLLQAQALREEKGVQNIGLSGGVFQNKKLADYVTKLLQNDGFNARLPERIPANDAGICAGQVVEHGMSPDCIDH